MPNQLGISTGPIVVQVRSRIPSRRTYLCKGPGVGSNQGKLLTGQEAVGLEPGLAQENGCLAGPRHLHDGPQPERVRGTVELSGKQRCHSFFQG